MREKLTFKERYKFLKKIHQDYQKAGEKQKGEILNIVCQATGLHRKRAIFLLSKKSYLIEN